MKNMLEGKIILITGSSRGIGAATAKLAALYGAKVILHGKTKSEELKNLASALKADYIACDVSDKRAVELEVKRISKKVGRIDGLVNCAGVVDPKYLLDTNDSDWLDDFKINVLGTLHFCQAIIPYMRKAKYGRIVNVASARGHATTASNRSIAYSVSKAGVVNLTAALAKECAPEIAEVILFLVSDRASFINGQTILADGGYSIAGK